MSDSGPSWVLLVDDDEDIRDTIQILLQLRGFTVETAPDGQAGLERIRKGPPPALVILDFMMPRMNGEEFRAAQLGDPRAGGDSRRAAHRRRRRRRDGAAEHRAHRQADRAAAADQRRLALRPPDPMRTR